MLLFATLAVRLAQTESPDVWGLVDKGGVLAAVLLALVTGARRVWVFGWQYDELTRDRDQWKAYALRGTDIAEKTVDTARIGLEQRAAARLALAELLDESKLQTGGDDEPKRRPRKR